MARRIKPWAAGLIALLPLAVNSQAQPASPGVFAAPIGPVVLTRTLRRALPDGAEIVSTRRYELRIVANGDGYLVEGRLIDAEITAPDSLKALAALERSRPDTGLFPFRLDRAGMIASGAAPTDRTAGEAAASNARAAIAGSSLTEADRAEARAQVDRLLQRGGSGARWPADLFNPAPGLRSQTSKIELAGGQAGVVTTTIDARSEAQGAMIERTVVTETGGDRRVTQEVYTVRPQQG